MWGKKLYAKKSKELSALSVAKIKASGRHSVGGLCLNVEGNSRVWILRAVVGKRLDKNRNLKLHRRDMGLGPYPEVSLAEARAKATELRLQIRNGSNPIAHKQEQLEKLYVHKLRNKTFIECTKVVMANKTRELKNHDHIRFDLMNK